MPTVTVVTNVDLAKADAIKLVGAVTDCLYPIVGCPQGHVHVHGARPLLCACNRAGTCGRLTAACGGQCSRGSQSHSARATVRRRAVTRAS